MRRQAVERLQHVWRARVPAAVRRRVNALRAKRREAAWRKPRNFGDLRRTIPYSTWGASRGGSIPRAYIAQFMERHAADIRGHALEIAGDEYIKRYGTGVTRTDVIDVLPGNPNATIVADLVEVPPELDGTFDCVLVTQVLSWIYDVPAAFAAVHRILAPGGVLLATTPGIARIAPVESELFGEWWHFTAMSARRAAEEAFGDGHVDVETFGNVLTTAASLYGLGTDDVSPDELSVTDPAFPLVVAIRAAKAK